MDKKQQPQHHPNSLLLTVLTYGACFLLLGCIITRPFNPTAHTAGSHRWHAGQPNDVQPATPSASQSLSLQAGSRAALVTVLDLSDPEGSVTGAAALLKSVLQHAPGHFQALELLVPNQTAATPALLQRARVAGWRVRRVDLPTRLTGSQQQQQQAVGSPYSSSWLAKLHIWSMTDYQQIVYLDPSAVFVQPVLGSFTPPSQQLAAEHGSAGCQLWAPRMSNSNPDGAQTGSINSSMLVVHPDVNEHARLLQRLASTQQVDERTFFNTAFGSKSGSSWCRLEDSQGGVVRADRYSTSKNKQQRVLVLHFSGLSVKPWKQQKQCPADLEAACSTWRKAATSDSWPVTVVTAYYAGPNKHGGAKYEKWGRHFMSQRVPMVVISDNISAVPAISLRDPKLTLTLEVSVGEFVVSQPAYEQHWQQQHEINPERSRHSTHLYKVWAEKTAHVMRAIAANPFNSSHYVWVDFGAFRDPALWQHGSWSVHAERFPTHDRLLMLKAPVPHPAKWVGGGIWGGTVRAWQVWSELVYNTLRTELHNGTRFLGDDQILMTLVLADHPEVACVVKHTKNGRNAWFYLQDYLAGEVPVDSTCSEW